MRARCARDGGACDAFGRRAFGTHVFGTHISGHMDQVSGHMDQAPRQLPLALGFRERFGREDFLAGPSNAAALALVERWPDWPARTVALVGPEGSGKSHLAAIWAKAAGARSIASHAIAPAGVPTALATGALVIEDLQIGACEEAA